MYVFEFVEQLEPLLSRENCVFYCRVGKLFDICRVWKYLAALRIEFLCIGLPHQTLFDMEQDEKKNTMAEFDAEDEEAIR